MIWTTTCDFHHGGILTSVDSDEPVQPPFKLGSSKNCRSVALKSKNIQATSIDSHQTAFMHRLVWTFASRTYHIVGNVTLRLMTIWVDGQADLCMFGVQNPNSGHFFSKLDWVKYWKCYSVAICFLFHLSPLMKIKHELGPPGFTSWISFAPVFSFIYWWVLIFALPPFYILIYMFYDMMHGYVRGLSYNPNIYVFRSPSALRVWGWRRENGLSPPLNYFYCSFQGGTSFVDHLCYLSLAFVMLSHLFIVALWSPAGKGLTSLLLFVMFNCVFDTFPCGILGLVWYLIVSIPYIYRLSYFH